MRKVSFITASLIIIIQTFVFGQAVINDAGIWSNSGIWNSGNIGDNISEDITTKTNGNPKFSGGEEVIVNGNYSVGSITFVSQYLTIQSGFSLTLGSEALYDDGNGTSKNFTGDNGVIITIPAAATMIIWGDLIVKNNIVLVVSGTLIIAGDVDLKNGGNLTISGNGSMAVGGDLNGGNGTDIATSGNATLNVDGALNISDVGGSSISGPIGSITAGSCTSGTLCTSTTLPIELLFFDVNERNSNVAINWSTASEENNDYFTIERSKDGLNYSVIGTLPGSGNSAEMLEYSFIDRNPLFGSSYYRLKQTDFDGASETFAPVAVEFTSLVSGDLKFTNPVKRGDAVTIYTNANDEELLTVSVYNMTGEQIVNKKFTGVNYSFDLSADVKPGMYFVKVSSISSEKTGRLIVQ